MYFIGNDLDCPAQIVRSCQYIPDVQQVILAALEHMFHEYSMLVTEIKSALYNMNCIIIKL